MVGDESVIVSRANELKLDLFQLAQVGLPLGVGVVEQLALGWPEVLRFIVDHHLLLVLLPIELQEGHEFLFLGIEKDPRILKALQLSC